MTVRNYGIPARGTVRIVSATNQTTGETYCPQATSAPVKWGRRVGLALIASAVAGFACVVAGWWL